MKKIAVIKNVLGAEVGAYDREDWGEACAIIDDGDTVVLFADGEKFETLKGAEFVRLYGGEKFEKCAICGRENADEWRDELRGYICAECATL